MKIKLIEQFPSIDSRIKRTSFRAEKNELRSEKMEKSKEPADKEKENGRRSGGWFEKSDDRFKKRPERSDRDERNDRSDRDKFGDKERRYERERPSYRDDRRPGQYSRVNHLSKRASSNLQSLYRREEK